MDIVRHKCVFRGCGNDDRIQRSLSYFKFPVSNLGRTRKWQENCGNVYIASMTDMNELKRKVICELHFLPKDIRRNSKRKLLTNTAVPMVYRPKPKVQDNGLFSSSSTFSTGISPCLFVKTELETVGEHIKTYSRKCSNSDKDSETNNILQYIPDEQPPESSYNASISNDSRCSPTVIEQEGNTQSITEYLLEKKLKECTEKIVVLKKKLLAHRSQINRLKKKKESLSVKAVLDKLLMDRSSFVKTFIKMQLRHKSHTEWSKNEHELAISLYHKSPSAYNFMLNSLKFSLPSLKSLQNWLKIPNLKTTLSTAIVKEVLNAEFMSDQETQNEAVLGVKDETEFGSLTTI